jgi:hypothetical protein
MANNKHKTIITIFLCVTFLFTGWTAGASFGYKSGFAESERQNTLTQLDSSKKTRPETNILIGAVARARADLLIRYHNIPDRDFATILAAHQKSVALLCMDYQKFATSDTLIEICQQTIIPNVKITRDAVDAYLIKNGLN